MKLLSVFLLAGSMMAFTSCSHMGSKSCCTKSGECKDGSCDMKKKKKCKPDHSCCKEGSCEMSKKK